MVLLITGMLIAYAHRGALSVAAPSMMKELRLSEAEMGLLLSAFFLSYSLMQVPAGLVEDKMTAVWLLTISLSGLGLCSPNTWTLTQAVCPKNLVGTVSGIQNFGGNLGGFIAPALTGYIAHRTNSFSLALSITGALLVVGIFSYAFLIGRGALVEDAEPEVSAA